MRDLSQSNAFTNINPTVKYNSEFNTVLVPLKEKMQVGFSLKHFLYLKKNFSRFRIQEHPVEEFRFTDKDLLPFDEEMQREICNRILANMSHSLEGVKCKQIPNPAHVGAYVDVICFTGLFDISNNIYYGYPVNYLCVDNYSNAFWIKSELGEDFILIKQAPLHRIIFDFYHKHLKEIYREGLK